MFVKKEAQTPQDWPAIGVFMAKAGIPINTDAEIQQFTSGLANLNYLLELTDGQKVVFRRPPAGPLPPGAYNLAREFSIYHHLGQQLSFVPKGLALCTDVSVIGVPFFIMEFCEGSSLGRELPETLNKVSMIGDKLSQLVIESLADLHKLDPLTIGLAELGNPEGFIKRQIKGWQKRGNLAFTPEQILDMQVIGNWLSTNEPTNKPTSLVHHDYKLDNILIDTDEFIVTGVIDWEMATIGNPLFDLALTLAVWGEPEDTGVYNDLCMMPHLSEGWWPRSKALQAYCKQSGLKVSANDWKFYWLLALLRMAVVFAQLAKLYERQKDMENKASSKLHIAPIKFGNFASNILKKALSLTEQQGMDF